MDRFRSIIAACGHAVRRLRYRHVALWQLAPETIVDQAPSEYRLRWGVAEGNEPEPLLECPAGSELTYAATLPPRATIVTRCGLTIAPGVAVEESVTFEIDVQGEGVSGSARCTVGVSSAMSGRPRRALSARVAGTGPARITLRTRRHASGEPGGDVVASWGSLQIATPRPLADVASVVRSSLAAHGIRGLWHLARPRGGDARYRQQIADREPTETMLAEQRISHPARQLRFSLITLLAPSPSQGGWQTVHSVLNQTYPDWEWILLVMAGAQTPRGVGADPRVRVVHLPSGTSRAAAWNTGFAAAQGQFAGLLDEHDQLAPSALYEMACALNASTDVDLLYSDEDHVGPPEAGRHGPRLKPAWSPERLLASNYIGRLSMLRVAAVQLIGGFRETFDGVEEWDLLLRLSRTTARVRRLPLCLYHRWQGARPEPAAAADLVLIDHFAQRGWPAAVTRVGSERRAVWSITDWPSVSVVIPNRDAAEVFSTCVRGLLDETAYPSVELIVVDNGSTDRAVLDLYRSLERDRGATIVPFDRPFNYSAACNRGAEAARGDVLLFLNNDIEIIDSGWLEELVRWAQLPEIGVVGAKLLFPDRRVQHAGVVFGLGLVGHIFAQGPEGVSTPFGSTESYRNYLAVTGACQMLRRDVFRQLGGYDERFRLSFSDVMLCLKAWGAGYRVVYTPHARLVHHESYTRKRDDSIEDIELLARYLRDSGFEEDPYFHPELNPKSLTPAMRPTGEPTARHVVREYVDRLIAAAERRDALFRPPVETG